MKRLLIALGIGASVFGGIFGLAAGLDVNSDTLGAGSDIVAACQDNPVSVSYTPTYVSDGYDATTVTVGGLESTCNDKSIKVTLTESDGTSLGEDSDSTGSGSSVGLTFSGVAAADVDGVHVTIYG